MIRASAVVAFVLSAGFLAGCQMTQTAGPAGSPLDGNWASSDGIFVATFQNNSFSSRDARTGAVLAQGSYALQGRPGEHAVAVDHHPAAAIGHVHAVEPQHIELPAAGRDAVPAQPDGLTSKHATAVPAEARPVLCPARTLLALDMKEI